MSSPVVTLFFSLFLLLLTAADAFNITKILSKYPDFTTFNNYLIQSGVAAKINSMHTVTVLAVANGNINEVSGLSSDALKKILSVHVVLDYYDSDKLEALPASKPMTLTTLYQQSGQAQNRQGFLTVKRQGKGGGIALGSAAPGSTLNSMFIKSIDSEPYDVSVLQISSIISIPVNATTTPPPAHGPVASPPSDSTTPPTASPPHPSKAPTPSVDPLAVTPAADGPGSSAADSKSSAVSLITSGDHLRAILMIFITSAWFLLTMT